MMKPLFNRMSEGEGNENKTWNGRKRKEWRNNPMMYNWNKVYTGCCDEGNFNGYTTMETMMGILLT